MHVGLTLVSRWTHLGIIVGSFVDHACILLGSCWVHVGIILEKHKIIVEYCFAYVFNHVGIFV